MKFRSALLFACLLVVPTVAMFSHRIPADWRSAVRAAASRTVASWTQAGSAGGVPAADAPAAAPAVASVSAPGPVATNIAAAPLADRTAPPVVGSAFRALPPAPAGDASDDVRQQLARLGAVGIECRPMHGMHVASCGVALDVSGQLMRVFQASGPDPDAATRTLLADVTAWRSRLVEGPPQPRAAAVDGRRF